MPMAGSSQISCHPNRPEGVTAEWARRGHSSSPESAVCCVGGIVSRLSPSPAAARAAALGLLALTFALLAPPPALAASAPDQGVPWEPEPLSRALYGTRAPDANPDVQRHVVEA